MTNIFDGIDIKAMNIGWSQSYFLSNICIMLGLAISQAIIKDRYDDFFYNFMLFIFIALIMPRIIIFCH